MLVSLFRDRTHIFKSPATPPVASQRARIVYTCSIHSGTRETDNVSHWQKIFAASEVVCKTFSFFLCVSTGHLIFPNDMYYFGPFGWRGRLLKNPSFRHMVEVVSEKCWDKWSWITFYISFSENSQNIKLLK